jgi:hypothetical protein
MRFPHPVSTPCPCCGQPTVEAETSIGTARVHCGTWRWQCDLTDNCDDTPSDVSAPPAIPFNARELAA